MPNEALVVACPKCGMQYEIPPEYLGQSAECSGCSFTFVLALPDEKRASAPPVKTDIATACSKCGSRFEVAATFLGETAECPDCKALFVITDIGECVNATPPEEEEPPPPPPPSSSRVQAVPPPRFANRPPASDASSRRAEFGGLTVTEAEKDMATNTVKISRKAFGMKPDVKEHFYNNLPPPAPEPERPKRTPPPPPVPPPAPPAPAPPAPAPSAKSIPPVKPERAPKVWWKFWTWFR